METPSRSWGEVSEPGEGEAGPPQGAGAGEPRSLRELGRARGTGTPPQEAGLGIPKAGDGSGSPEGGGPGVAGARRGRAPFPAGRFRDADGAMAAAAG